MLGKHKIIVDEWAEVWDMLEPYADGHFWQWSDVDFDPDAVYILGRNIIRENYYPITELATEYPGRIVFCNPAEGSQTILLQLQRMMIGDFVRDGRIGMIASGDLEPGIDYCRTDCYFSNIVEYTENKHAQTWAALNWQDQRPYTFLFLNGRLRPHRKWAIDAFRYLGLLDRALWTNLNSEVAMQFTSVLHPPPEEPIRCLPPEYEIDRAVPNLDKAQELKFAKHFLFNDTWGDAIVNPRCYTDTWFSVVTETIFDYPHTFFTEKIWKPILMGHPFVVLANPGYYRSLHNAGFRTFGSVIDESFDYISDPKSRIETAIKTVYNIVESGADKFWHATRDICKYNQQRLVEFNREQRQQLPRQIEQYLNERLRVSS